ncbi:MAG: helix-turn-helix transcriptional regulator, partial [Acidimicrobiia bacterium]
AGARGGSSVQPASLVLIAQACRARERLRFGYVDGDGNMTSRHVEPHQLVHTARRWYLVARDRDRDAWRTFRVDRIERPTPTGLRFVPIDPPDAAALVAEGMAVSAYKLRARVVLKVPYERATQMVPRTIGVLERRRGGTLLRIGADDVEWLARYLAGLDCSFRVLEPFELKEALASLGARLIRTSA